MAQRPSHAELSADKARLKLPHQAVTAMTAPSAKARAEVAFRDDGGILGRPGAQTGAHHAVKHCASQAEWPVPWRPVRSDVLFRRHFTAHLADLVELLLQR